MNTSSSAPHSSTPAFTVGMAHAQLLALYGLTGRLQPLPSERDQNFHVSLEDGREFTLKFVNADEAPQAIEFQTALLNHAATVDPDLPLPRLQPLRDGSAIGFVDNHNGTRHAVRLVSYLPGTPLAEVKSTQPLLRDLGRVLGRLNRALSSFGHPGAFRPSAELDWEIRQTPRVRERLHFVDDQAQRGLLERVLHRWDSQVQPLLKNLRCGVIHNDANDWNVIVDGEQVSGLIDFGDASFSPLIAELAVACAYAMFGKASPWQAAGEIVAGYHAELPLQDLEFRVLPHLIAARLAISVSVSASRRTLAETNPYWMISAKPAWEMLARLDATDPHIAAAILRKACGLEAAPGAARLSRYLSEQGPSFAALMHPAPARQNTRVLPLTDPADPLCRAQIDGDPDAMLSTYAELQGQHGFTLGLGLWGERRCVYAADFFASKLIEGGRRDMHLGLDLFAPAGTQLFTPLAATVVATAICPEAQGYGGLVLLEHRTGPGLCFRSLWGHLNHDSVLALKVGEQLAAGAAVARLGDSAENGGWTPHLHLQLLLNEYADVTAIPGVGETEFAEIWADLFPPAYAFAGLNAEATQSREGRSKDELLQARRAQLAPNLSLSYRRPLKIVRGRDVWLIDDSGRAYLDCYNNVAHIGHCHPGVVAAIQQQVARLNTNTRYLHDNIIEYSSRLAATLPPELDTFFFVNSGSEANDLALRIARLATARREVCVLDWAYHGHSAELIAISAYKYKRRGGQGRPEHTLELPLPEFYRQGGDLSAEVFGQLAGADAAKRIGAWAADGRAPALFIAETIPSVAGQVFLPPGYLPQVYAAIRAAGGLCMADEVQVGFGRTGAQMWAFQEHGVVPDMVSMGKPAGNGHPLAVLAVRRELADKFANGMEYFNTFGGNPVSCAAGLAVLDALDRQHLLANAASQGDYLRQRLAALAQRHPLIGDVRGRGLFLGVELVTDRLSKAHAGSQAADVVNRMRELGVLAGTDGPFDNVIKFRPPMTMQREHADLLLQVLDQALSELRA